MKAISYSTAPLSDVAWEKVEQDRLIAGSPARTYKVLYTSKSEEFSSGIYECTPGKWKISYTEDEFCTLLEGHLRLTSDQGDVQEFKAPDSFLIPSGFQGVWEPLTKLRKFFVIYEQKAK